MSQKIHESPIEFIEEPTEIKNCKYVNTESPYKNLIKTNTKIILNDSTSDAADFKSPVATRKSKNLTSMISNPVEKWKLTGNIEVQKRQSKRGRGRRKASAKNSTTKIITDNFKYFRENPEHIQMAIALSKSSYEAECGSSSQSPPKEDISDIGDILRNARPALLERFGFTACRKILPVESKRVTTVSTETTKKNKNRFKYITPILNIRTSEERNSLIDSKIALILHQNNPQPKNPNELVVNSTTLNNYISREQHLFYWDEFYQKSNFYVKSLEIPQNVYKCGILLKDWDSIPGRDRSPCKMANDNSTREDPINNKEQYTDLSSVQNGSKTVNGHLETRRETILSEATTLAKITSKGNFPTFSFSTDIKDTNLGSFGSDSKDSAIPSSFTGSAKSTVNSFSSSCRSASPDLFGSDDEIDQQFLYRSDDSVPKSEFISETYTENVREIPLVTFKEIHGSLEKFSDTPGNCIKSGLVKINNNHTLKKNDIESEPNEIINLTDDDILDKSQNKSLSPDVDIVIYGNDDCISQYSKNQTKKSSTPPKADIYNLDEFENENKIERSHKTIGYFKDISGENVGDMINETHKSFNVPKFKNNVCEDDRKTLVSTNEENHHIEVSVDMVGSDKTTSNINSSFSDIEIANDNDNISSKIIYNDNSINRPANKLNAKKSLSPSTASKTESCVNAYIIESTGLVDLSNNKIIANQDSSLDDTPKRNRGYKRSSSFYDEALSDKSDNSRDFNNKKSDYHSTSSNTSNLEKTPKKRVESKGIKSPCFDEPICYDSTNLNVTDYVNNMLDQENFSFDKTELVNDGRCNVNNYEEMSLSQDSQSSVILDEELNYSSHFATPARNKKKYSSDHETEELEDIVFLSPELPDSGLETLPPKNVSVNPKMMPKATITEQTLTPDNFIIKTDNVTPMLEYDKMTTPLINKELQKVGVKPLKRTRGAQLLKYIYETTHPFVGPKNTIVPDNSESDEDMRVIKRRKNGNCDEGPNNLECGSTSVTNSLIFSNSICASSVDILGDKIIENEKLEDLIFERKQLTKIASCKVPLQIVWHNLVSSDQAIKENILLYEPLQLESLHKMLKEQGFRFHIQDLLTFLDKKCITIRTAQKQGKSNR